MESKNENRENKYQRAPVKISGEKCGSRALARGIQLQALHQTKNSLGHIFLLLARYNKR
jgi:hypothetical protein